MIRRSTRALTSLELRACELLNPLHALFATKSWLDWKVGLVETLEFRVDKAWFLPECDRGPGCCPGSLLLRTPEREFVCLTGTVSSSSKYDFRWASSYKKGHCEGDHVVIERWQRSRRIYSARFSGAPVDHVWLDQWDPRWGRMIVEGAGGPCQIVRLERPNDLPEEN